MSDIANIKELLTTVSGFIALGKWHLAKMRVESSLSHKFSPLEMYLAVNLLTADNSQQKMALNFIKKTAIDLMRAHPNGATQIMVCFTLAIDHEEEKKLAGMFNQRIPGTVEQIRYWETVDHFLGRLAQRADFPDHAPKIKAKMRAFLPDAIGIIKDKAPIGTNLEFRIWNKENSTVIPAYAGISRAS